MDDNMYPNDGEQMGAYYPEPTAKKPDSLANKKSIQKDVKEWFDEQIDNSGRIESIQIDEVKVNGTSVERKVSVEVQLLAHQMLINMLTQKKSEFEQWLKEHNK